MLTIDALGGLHHSGRIGLKRSFWSADEHPVWECMSTRQRALVAAAAVGVVAVGCTCLARTGLPVLPDLSGVSLTLFIGASEPASTD